ncbi:bone marrow proteoglycan [Leptosomus discolor]
MPPRLLLALALLGSASASRPAPAGPEAEAAAPEPPVPGARCPLPGEARAFSVRDPRGAATFRYAIVTRCQPFVVAQSVCARCYGGRLASIHSVGTNALLQHRARLCTNRGQVWIGATTQPLGRIVQCHWADRSPWNFSYWLHGFPLLSGSFCTSLCTNNGHWRSLDCRVRLPFICEY